MLKVLVLAGETEVCILLAMSEPNIEAGVDTTYRLEVTPEYGRPDKFELKTDLYDLPRDPTHPDVIDAFIDQEQGRIRDPNFDPRPIRRRGLRLGAIFGGVVFLGALTDAERSWPMVLGAPPVVALSVYSLNAYKNIWERRNTIRVTNISAERRIRVLRAAFPDAIEAVATEDGE